MRCESFRGCLDFFCCDNILSMVILGYACSHFLYSMHARMHEPKLAIAHAILLGKNLRKIFFFAWLKNWPVSHQLFPALH